MNQHLTEQQLIDYQFKLADAAGASAAQAHLDECDECRQRLEKLVRKFATLNLLRGEIEVSENLLSKTVENAVQVRPARVMWLYRLPAAGAIAAAIIVGAAVLLVSNSRQNNRIAPTMGPGPLAQNAAPASPVDQDYAFRKDQPAPPAVERVGKAESATPSKPSSLSTSLADAQARAPSEALGRVGLAPPEPASAPGGNVKAEGLGDGRVEGVPPSNRGQDARDTVGHRQAALDAASRMAQTLNIAEQPPFAPASAIELVVLPRRENVQLTIYGGADLTLVRERRNLTLKRGWNWLQFMCADGALIDPTSLSLEPLEHKDGVQVQQLVFPPRLRKLGRWLIHSEIGGPVPFELTYFTSGLSWRAFYMGTLSQDERKMSLESYVRISNNSGENYENAQTRLILGRFHLLDQIAYLACREHAYDRPEGPVKGVTGLEGEAKDLMRMLDRSGANALFAPPVITPKQIVKEGLSEYFLYTIEGTETIPNEWGKRLLSFEIDEVPVTSLYKYDEERWGTETIRFLSFANDEKHKLGQTPLPDGTVRIYGRAGEQGHLSYVGVMDVKYIPVNEEVELNLGPARLVAVKPILIDYKAENHTFDNQGNISGWDEVRTWRIEIANTRPLPVDLEVTRDFGTPYWTLKLADAAVTYEKYDATHARFKLTIEPRSKRVFEYTVTTYHGVRQEALSNAK
jgi:hypothetical protein